MLWTEKYRPKRLSEVIGQESFKLDAENWVDINDMPNVLFFGSAGTGKTAAGMALAQEFLGTSPNFLELNASDDRRLEDVRTNIKGFAQQGKIGDVPFKICLLDEMDGMTTDAQNALKRIMERYADNIRFIITCNDRSKIVYPIQSRCANYFFQTIKDSQIRDVVLEVLKKEGKDLPTGLDEFIASYQGDLRRVLTELQAATAANRPLVLQVNKSLEKYGEVVGFLVDKDYNNATEKMFTMLAKGKTMKDICIGLHESIISSEIEYKKKFSLLRVIGEAEWRSQTMTPRILVTWMVSQCR